MAAFASPLIFLSQRDELGLFPLVAFVLYLIATGVLLSLLAGTLFQQHELRQYKVGVLGLLLIMTLIALPLGYANWLIELVFESEPVPTIDSQGGVEPLEFQPDFTTARITITLMLYFLMLPTLVITEAIMAAYVAIKSRKRSD